MIKTYRGLLADGGQDRIRLSTIKGKVGYKIIKFELFPYAPGNADYESLVTIYKEQQTTVPTATGTSDFTDSSILAAGTFAGVAAPAGSLNFVTIFENEIFNQDIFITHTQNTGTAAINYYIELEVVLLDDAGAEYTTLKDMRHT